MNYLTTGQLAARFGVTEQTIRRKADAAGVGMNLGGHAGWRYSEADIDKLERSLRPQPVAIARRRRRSA